MRTFYKSDEPISQFAYPMNNHTKYYTRVSSKTKQNKKKRDHRVLFIFIVCKNSIRQFDIHDILHFSSFFLLFFRYINEFVMPIRRAI